MNFLPSPPLSLSQNYLLFKKIVLFLFTFLNLNKNKILNLFSFKHTHIQSCLFSSHHPLRLKMEKDFKLLKKSSLFILHTLLLVLFKLYFYCAFFPFLIGFLSVQHIRNKWPLFSLPTKVQWRNKKIFRDSVIVNAFYLVCSF